MGPHRKRAREGRYHRFCAFLSMPESVAVPDAAPAVSVVQVNQFRKACKKGLRFAAFLRELHDEKLVHQELHVASMESQPGFQSFEVPPRETLANMPYSAILARHAQVFGALPPGLPPDRGDEHSIPVKADAKPAARAPYRLSPRKYEECRPRLEKLLEMGHI